MAAWIVSNCHLQPSKRNELVAALKNHSVSVDTFGACGQKKCSEKSHHGNCYREIADDYKFVFAFENSLCQDYITEKFYNAFDAGMVPIVYGLGNTSALAPPHSHINVFDFKSVKELAEYLIYLDKNPKKYLEYWKWRDNFRVISSFDAWCGACERIQRLLALPDKGSGHVKYDNIESWWKYVTTTTNTSACIHPKADKFDDLQSLISSH